MARFLAVGADADGRLELFTLGSGGELWHIWHNPGAESGWSAWDTLGAPSGVVPVSLAVAPADEGGLTVFAGGLDGQIWYLRQQAAPGTGWTAWATLGAPATGAVAS